MSDVTQFSGMLAKMVLEYSRSASRKRGRRAAAAPEAVASTDAPAQDERAIRAAMESALERRAQAKRVA